MKNLLGAFLFLGIILLSWSSCNNDNSFDDQLDTNREFAVPLFYSTTKLTDLLENLNEETFITMGPDDLITLNYRGNVVEERGADLFDFIQSVPIPLTDSVMSVAFEIVGALDINLMKLSGGQLVTHLENQFDEELDVTIKIPSLTKDGVAYERTHTLDPLGDKDWFEPLNGMDLMAVNDSVTIIYEAIRSSNGEQVLIDASAIGVLNMEFSYIEGIWGQEILDLARDTIEIEFFEEWVQGDVYFENPVINVAVDNSFGFPVRSVANVMDILTVNGDVVSLNSQYLDDGIDFDYPDFSEIGVVKRTNFSFDKTNSDIVTVLSSGPVSVDYDIDAVSNPDNLPDPGYMTDTSVFRVQLEVELPFHGRVTNFEAQDAFDVDFSDYDDVNYVEFKMISENGIPLGMGLQLYFADKDGIVFDSLYQREEIILEPAPVDSDGDVTGVLAEKTTFATIDKTKFDKIKSAKKLIVSAFFSTSDSLDDTSVLLKADQEVNIRMGMKVGTN